MFYISFIIFNIGGNCLLNQQKRFNKLERGSQMFSSVGYHTFAISMNLIQKEADRLFEDFKKYRDRTKKIYIEECPKYEADPFGRHYEMKYFGTYNGLRWRIRFSKKGFMIEGKHVTCSIKAIINPKILAGEKSYIMAAHASYLEKIEEVFNEEAANISPILKRFSDYSLNRLDYCINFDVSELGSCPEQLTRKMPEMMMELIRCGDIPKNFKEEYKEKFQFYLQSGSVVINCYWKYPDLEKNFADCSDLEKSKDIIRFEVQYRYPKVIEVLTKMKKELGKFRAKMMSQLRGQAIYDSEHNPNGVDELKFKQSVEMLKGSVTDRALKKICIMGMMSDEKCIEVIKKYFNKTIRRGDYYTFEKARRIIEADVSDWEKIIRLTDTLRLVKESGGIAKAKASVQGKDLEDFRRTLRNLDDLRINPVTIPEEWGIEYMPNLLNAYYNKLDKEMEERH